MRKVSILILPIVLMLGLNVGTAQAYSYAEVEDPLVLIFKSAVAAARAGKWAEVSEKAKEGIALQKNHLFEGDHLTNVFEEVIAKKDISGTAETFAHLVFLSIREKFHRNKKDNFNNYKNSKSRLALARKSYIDILDGNIKKDDSARSATILENFNLTLKKIGNPGLFGFGKTPPDSAGYDKAVKTIEELIVKSFPSFAVSVKP